MVLTAGHCVIDADGSPRLPGTVKLGWPDLADATPPAGAEVLPVARVVPHPAFAARPSPATASDLALLVLGQNSTRAPVALPPPGTRLPDRQRVWAAGYRCARPRAEKARGVARGPAPLRSVRAPLASQPPNARSPPALPRAPRSGPGASYGRTANGFFTEAFTRWGACTAGACAAGLCHW